MIQFEREKDRRFFKPILIGPYRVSVQASESHACSPRENGLSMEGYTHFEVQITRSESYRNGSLRTRATSARYMTPENMPELAPYREYWQDDLGSSMRASYVPLAHVQEIVEILRSRADSLS